MSIEQTSKILASDINSIKTTADASLPKSGGTMSGSISFQSGLISNNSKNLDVIGGNGWGTGATLQLNSVTHPSNAGEFNLIAYGSDGGETRLVGRHGDNLYWNGSPVLTSASAGGTFNLPLTGQHIATIGTDIRSIFIGGDNGLNENSPLLCFDGPNGDVPGRWYLLSANGEQRSWLIGYPNGALEINGHAVLTSAGGTMTGSLLLSNILSGDNDGTNFYGGNAWRTGGYIELGGPNHTYPNHIQINGGSRQVLEDVGAGWHIAGSQVLTTAGGTMSGDLINVYIRRNGLSGETNILGATTMDNGATIALYGQNCTAGYGYGSALIRGADKGTCVDLVVHPHNGVSINDHSVITAVESWRDGYNFYYRFSNGFTIQGGYIVLNETISAGYEKTKTITLHSPFWNNLYTSWINCNGVGVLTGGTQDQTTSSFAARAYAASGETRTWNGVDWLAIGLM